MNRRGRRIRSAGARINSNTGPLAPNKVASAVAWWDVATLPSVNSPTSVWTDSIGNEQAVAVSVAPIVNLLSVNKMLNFGLAGPLKFGPTIPSKFTGNQACTLIMNVNAAVVGGYQNPLGFASTNAPDYRFQFTVNGSSFESYRAINGTNEVLQTAVSAFNFNTNMTITLRYNGALGTGKFWFNKTNVPTTVDTWQTFVPGLDQGSIGGLLYSGSALGILPWTGLIGDVVVCNSYLDDAVLSRVIDYLAAKLT